MKYLKLFHKYVKFNKNFFNRRYNQNKKKNKLILVELFDLKATTISLSLFAHAFDKKSNFEIVGFYSVFQSLKKKIKFYFNWYINIFGFLTLYKSFGINKVMIPNKNLNLKKIKNIHLNIIKKIRSKKDILNIKIENVYLGDLIYDSYIRENNLLTIDINEKLFKNFILDVVKLFFYWENYFKKNKVASILATHSVYLAALPLRIALKKKIKVFCVNYDKIYRLTSKRPLIYGHFEEYPSVFKKLSVEEQNRGLSLAKHQLNKRFKGNKDILYQISTPLSDGTYSVKRNNKDFILNKNNNFKILIAAHDFNDAPHVHKDLIFEDMYEWLNYLGKKSLKKKGYDWYVKLHPADYQHNQKKMEYFISKYKKFQLLPRNVSHNQLINEGINCVLTCFGSIGHEYPFFGIPVVNAGHNPHIAYNFNYHPKTKKDYEILFNKIETLKVNKKHNKDIYQFYMVRYFLDYNLFPGKMNTNNLNNIEIFEKFFKRYNKKDLEKILKDYNSFIYSNERRLISKKQLNIKFI